MSVTDPMVVEETKVTWAYLISGVVCMLTPSQRPIKKLYHQTAGSSNKHIINLSNLSNYLT